MLIVIMLIYFIYCILSRVYIHTLRKVNNTYYTQSIYSLSTVEKGKFIVSICTQESLHSQEQKQISFIQVLICLQYIRPFLYRTPVNSCTLPQEIPVQYSSKFLYIAPGNVCTVLQQIPVQCSSKFLYSTPGSSCTVLQEVPVE